MIYLVYEHAIDKPYGLGGIGAGYQPGNLATEAILFAGTDKTSAVQAFDTAMHKYFVISHTQKLELHLLAFNLSTTPGKLATKLSCFGTTETISPLEAADSAIVKQLLTDIKKAEYFYTLTHDGVNPVIRLACAECGREITTVLNKNITLSNTRLCDVCWSKYVTSEDGLAEYYLAIAMGRYTVAAFSNEDIKKIIESWNRRRNNLIKGGRFTEDQIIGIEAAAKAAGLEVVEDPDDFIEPDQPEAGEPDEPKISAPTDLLIVSQPNKTTYKVGERFNSTGMDLMVLYDDGSFRQVSVSDCIIQDKALTSDDEKVYILYIENDVRVHAELKITVTKNPLELTIHANSTKTTYVAGETFNPEGMDIELWYEDYSSKTLRLSECIIEPSTPLSVDTTHVTIYYIENDIKISKTYPITVLPAHTLAALAITKQPNRLTYTLDGDPFDPSGMEATAFYADGTSAVVYNLEFKVEHDEDNLYYVLVSYTENGITRVAVINIDMRTEWTVNGIRVARKPDTTTFSAGQPIDLSGLIIEAVYEDGSSTLFTDNMIAESAEFTVFADTPIYMAGTVSQKINVVYNQIWAESVVATASTAFNINLSTDYDVLDGITVSIENDNKTYKVGDSISPSEIIVRAQYAQYNSSENTKVTKRILSSDEYSVTGIDKPFTTAGIARINVTYTENYVTATASVNVLVAAATSSGSQNSSGTELGGGVSGGLGGGN